MWKRKVLGPWKNKKRMEKENEENIRKKKQIFGLHRRGKRRKTFAMQRRWRTEKELRERGRYLSS